MRGGVHGVRHRSGTWSVASAITSPAHRLRYPCGRSWQVRMPARGPGGGTGARVEVLQASQAAVACYGRRVTRRQGRDPRSPPPACTWAWCSCPCARARLRTQHVEVMPETAASGCRASAVWQHPAIPCPGVSIRITVDLHAYVHRPRRRGEGMIHQTWPPPHHHHHPPAIPLFTLYEWVGSGTAASPPTSLAFSHPSAQ